MTEEQLEDARQRVEILEALLDEIGSESSHGVTLIREDCFEEYARELADELGLIPDDVQWPFTCIDWERAADELRQDYSEVTFDGDEWLYRV